VVGVPIQKHADKLSNANNCFTYGHLLFVMDLGNLLFQKLHVRSAPAMPIARMFEKRQHRQRLG
jgi:hypothetical protein